MCAIMGKETLRVGRSIPVDWLYTRTFADWIGPTCPLLETHDGEWIVLSGSDREKLSGSRLQHQH